MEAKARFVAAGAVLLTAGIAALWFVFGRGGDEVVPAVPPAAAPVPAATSAAALQAAPATASPVTAEPPASTSQRSEAPAPASKDAKLRGRCVDASGAPLADCLVHLSGLGGNSERMDKWLEDHAEKPDWKNPPDVTTGADGTFVFAFWPPPPFQFILDLRHDGCGAMSGRWAALAEGSDTDVGDVAMTAGVQVTGRVVDKSGQPQAKEYVTLQRRERGGGVFDRVAPRWGDQVVSKPDGTFATRGWLPPGEYEVRTQKLELQSPKTLTLTAERPSEDITIVVTTPPATATISGRVVDETGAPARNVEIEDRSEHGRSSTTSGRDGRFELKSRDGDTGKKAVLHAVPGSYDVDEKQAQEVAWGATDVEFRVTRAGALTVRVTDAQQAPVETYTVRLIPRNRYRWSSSDSRARAQGKHEDGTVVIDGLTRGDWLLLVDFPSPTGLESLFEPFANDAGGSRRLDLRALPAVQRTLRVLTADDAPIAGTTVQLCDPFDQPFDDSRLLMHREHWLMNSGSSNALVLFEGTTDAVGRLELRGPGGRNLGLCVLGPGHMPLRRPDIRLDVADEFVVRVSRGARLHGRIVPPAAVAELKRLAGLGTSAGFGEQYRPRISFSDGQNNRFPKDHVTAGALASLRVADDGSFDASGLPAGSWKVQIDGMIAHEGGGGMGHAFGAGEVTLVEGQTTHQDLDLEYVLPGTVAGLVLLNGKPLGNGQVSLQGAGYWHNVRTDGEGRFTTSLFAGEYAFHLQRQRPANGWSTLSCPSRLVVVRGQTTTQTFAVSSSTLRVTLLDPGGKPVARTTVGVLSSEKEGAFLPPTDDAGVTENELTTETVTLRILPKALGSPEAQQKLWQAASARGDADPLGPHWITLQTVALNAGQTTAIEIHLTASAGY